MFGVGLHGGGTSVRAIAYDIGLRSKIRAVFDVRDNRSYPGSGTQLLDISGNGYDFNFGAAGAAPTFTGTANQRDAYLAFDGGDTLTYEAANETWMTAMHQAGADWWCAFGGYHATAAGALFGTNGTSTTGGTGANVNIQGGEAIGVRVRNAGSGVITSYTSTALLTENAPYFVGVSVNAAAGASGGFAQINGTAETFDATYTSPSAGAASQVMQIGALGNAAVPLGNGDRLYFAMFGFGGSAAMLTAMYRAYRRGIGI